MVVVGGRAGREKSVLLEREKRVGREQRRSREKKRWRKSVESVVCVTSCALRAPVE